MIALLATVLLVTSPCLAYKAGSDADYYYDIADLNGDANIYHAVISALKELKSRELEEKLGIQRTQPIIQRASSVCYDDLGCFEKNGTFKHLKQLPEPPESVNTQFLLYTRRNRDTPQFLDHLKPETVLKSNLDKTKPLKILTHGFGGKNNMTWMTDLRNAFLDTEDVNIITIDWSLGARIPYYIQAAVNSELVGAQAAVLYYFIKDNFGIMEKDLHCIGFSLGAHVVGFIGKRMKELRGTRPGRITGLDAASPLFEKYGDGVHLSKNDADFVDVVHTNADLLLYGGVGIGESIGHVDYFPNGGKRQPGCKSTLGGAFMDIFKGDKERTCNHERAVHLYIDSILDKTSCRFISYPCSNYSDFETGKCIHCGDSCGQMGYKSKGIGDFYLMTKDKSPFCAEHAKLTARFPKDIKRSYGSIILTLTGENGEQENITLTGKDEKLSPGGEKVFTVPINDVLMPLHSIDALYLRFNGWFAKGSETFALDH